MIIVDKVLSQVQAASSPLFFTHTNNHHASPRSFEGSILAYSTTMSREHQKLFYSTTAASRSICSDRQGVLDHLYPKRLFKSVRERCTLRRLRYAFILSLFSCICLQTLKVSITQGAQIFSKYMTDQIREDMERDHKVERGIMTREQADEESERWQQVRYPLRLQALHL